MKKPPNESLIEDISIELGSIIDPAFIEKDWYAVQLLSLIANFANQNNENFIFSGGTSLSKGFDLIKRFSEDLDFNIPDNLSRKLRSELRESLINDINQNQLFNVDEKATKSHDKSQFIQFCINYQSAFKHSSLRNGLKLELSFKAPVLVTQIKPIRSIISEVQKEPFETRLSCISPVETAANKLSALCWRITERNENYDRATIRHLYDLYALRNVISNNLEDFKKVAFQAIAYDKETRLSKQTKTKPAHGIIQETIDILNQQQKQYKEEYQSFAANMSYDNMDDAKSFNLALKYLNELPSMIL